MPSIRPTFSIRSSDSSISSSSDFSAYGNLSDGGSIDDSSPDNSQDDTSSSPDGHMDDLNLSIKANGFRQVNDTEVREIDEMDMECWIPPEPEDKEDDVIGSIANYDDDDDECGDSTWAKPSSLSSFGEEGSGSYKFKKKKLEAMDEVRNGKFMELVGQLIKSAGVDSSGNDGENWVDIVTSLSWEAASFVKPDAQEGKAMDPDGYVKIKCILTGSCSESRVIKGLVFKKHAAHKHMSTKYKNPRLLLIHGSLDLSFNGLSSFGSMQQEMASVKSIVDTIENCHPNVVLVEKSVSRGIQESILAKGMTLIFDMKLHRMERVARSIGSPISSSDIIATGQKLKQCDSFHIEKFVEEHAVPLEGGKKQSKTLMFLEGAPTRLGCTILLMGANSDELKRVKCVVRCAVVMAYHLMLETSYLLDQSAMFSTISSSDVLSIEQSTPVTTDEVIVLWQNESNSETNSTLKIKIPFSNGVHETGSPNFMSPSFQEVMNEVINQEGLSENVDQISNEDNLLNNEQQSLQDSSDTQNQSDSGEEELHCKDKIRSVLESESILVSMSSRNASKGTICQQRHFSQIKFYRSFDVPLGKFLRDNLLNQKLQCKTCTEPSEAHFFYYAHHNKQLTIEVKRLPLVKNLPGETEGKLWMWSRCGQCKIHDGTSKSTKRVLISTAASGLSFGKFLELSFSNNSSFKWLSSCGHSFDKDFLYFFGLGPMVAMFKYSTVANYSVSLPPLEMEFKSLVRGDFCKKESENVYLKGVSVFLDIEKSLKDLEALYVGAMLNIQGPRKEFSDILEMLEQEKSRFEVDVQNAIENGSEDNVVHNLLRLNRVRLEFLFESCLWDQRLHALLSSDFKVIDPTSIDLQAQKHLTEENGTSISENIDMSIKESPIDGQIDESEEIPTNGQTKELEEIPNETESLVKCQLSTVSYQDKDNGWIWAPFTDILREYMDDLQKGYMPKFKSFSSYTTESTARKFITDEISRLHIPFGANNDYIVSDYEDEFSSIIACALSLLNYEVSENSVESNGSSRNLTNAFSLIAPHLPSYSSMDSDGIRSPPSDSLEESHSSSFDGLDLLELVSYSASHPKLSMGLAKYSGKRKYSVVCLYADEFRKLRDRCCPSEVDYVASLSRCKNWDAKGGKSKSFFAKTLDDRFIIKEIKKTEFDSFMTFAPNYFEYMNECFELGNQTCLAKILGIYQVVIRATKNGKETGHNLVVMENLSFGRHITRQYDLKGALHARLSATSSGDVLLDQNFVNDMNVSPLYVSMNLKQNLQRAVYNDTSFLNSINVMDYSLLVGVDTKGCELSCGIIDYLRQYTWDKQLENWVKSSLVVRKNQLPTIISPKEYKKRFRKFIDTHFLSVPDHWCSQRSSNPCKLCGPAEKNGSSLQKS